MDFRYFRFLVPKGFCQLKNFGNCHICKGSYLKLKSIVFWVPRNDRGCLIHIVWIYKNGDFTH